MGDSVGSGVGSLDGRGVGSFDGWAVGGVDGGLVLLGAVVGAKVGESVNSKGESVGCTVLPGGLSKMLLWSSSTASNDDVVAPLAPPGSCCEMDPRLFFSLFFFVMTTAKTDAIATMPMMSTMATLNNRFLSIIDYALVWMIFFD
jgi:hypothetical protein